MGFPLVFNRMEDLSPLAEQAMGEKLPTDQPADLPDLRRLKKVLVGE
jgi:hypothetical protein